MMTKLTLQEKETGKLWIAVGLRTDSKGYPHFLIYNWHETEDWTWVSAKKFRLIKEDSNE